MVYLVAGIGVLDTLRDEGDDIELDAVLKVGYGGIKGGNKANVDKVLKSINSRLGR